MNDKIFVVENKNINCCVDTLLMALFYNKSILDKLLLNNLKQPTGIYLQEIIKTNFINQVRNNKSVLNNTIENIIKLCSNIGYVDNNSNINLIDFYIFLMQLFENQSIQIINKPDSTIQKHYIEFDFDLDFDQYINNSLDETKTSIKELLNNYIKKNAIINVPNIIAFSIKRFDNKLNKKNSIKVDIQKKIKPLKSDSIINNHEWYFHSVICYKGLKMNEGHYYALLNSKDKWYIYDNNKIPCIEEVKMDDSQIVNLIKSDSLFLIYKKN